MPEANPTTFLCEDCETETPKADMRVMFVRRFVPPRRPDDPVKGEAQVLLCPKCVTKRKA